MRIIDFETIRGLNISPEDCLKWAEYVIRKKYECHLPPKVSLKMPGDVFVNTMPSEIPELGRFGVKIVSRYPQRVPALQSEILLYDSATGRNLALMDGTWITAMRTGAVAALSIQQLQCSSATKYAFIGLGNTARAALMCMSHLFGGEENPLNIRLLAYKGQEEDFMRRFEGYPGLNFSVYADISSLIEGADVIVSCLTKADHILAADECFKPGVLVVPVHTRGFQNCDLFFDKVFADDRGHVCNFQYFNAFRQFHEFSEVFLGQAAGRENDEERILIYNIGISLHDVYFASQVYDRIEEKGSEILLFEETEKFWI